MREKVDVSIISLVVGREKKHYTPLRVDSIIYEHESAKLSNHVNNLRIRQKLEAP
jgi:hypothetical protein